MDTEEAEAVSLVCSQPFPLRRVGDLLSSFLKSLLEFVYFDLLFSDSVCSPTPILCSFSFTHPLCY